MHSALKHGNQGETLADVERMTQRTVSGAAHAGVDIVLWSVLVNVRSSPAVVGAVRCWAASSPAVPLPSPALHTVKCRGVVWDAAMVMSTAAMVCGAVLPQVASVCCARDLVPCLAVVPHSVRLQGRSTRSLRALVSASDGFCRVECPLAAAQSQPVRAWVAVAFVAVTTRCCIGLLVSESRGGVQSSCAYMPCYRAADDQWAGCVVVPNAGHDHAYAAACLPASMQHLGVAHMRCTAMVAPTWISPGALDIVRQGVKAVVKAVQEAPCQVPRSLHTLMWPVARHPATYRAADAFVTTHGVAAQCDLDAVLTSAPAV